MGVISGIIETKDSPYGLNMDAIRYLASLPHEDYSNVFALRVESTDSGNRYHHEFESDDYVGTVRSYEEGKPADTKCMYYVPWGYLNYCVFYDLGDECGTVCVMDLANPSRAADISGKAARSLPIENLIEMADQLFENDDADHLSEDLSKDISKEATNNDVNLAEVPTDHDSE